MAHGRFADLFYKYAHDRRNLLNDAFRLLRTKEKLRGITTLPDGGLRPSSNARRCLIDAVALVAV